jgi:hypothetical protein
MNLLELSIQALEYTEQTTLARKSAAIIESNANTMKLLTEIIQRDARYYGLDAIETKFFPRNDIAIVTMDGISFTSEDDVLYMVCDGYRERIKHLEDIASTLKENALFSSFVPVQA